MSKLQRILSQRPSGSPQVPSVPYSSSVDLTHEVPESEKAKNKATTALHPSETDGEGDSSRAAQPIRSSGDYHNSALSSPTDHLASVGEEKISRKKRPRKRHRFRVRLLLENTGSVARDHLASERTFLAYVRTSLAFAGAGIALVQLFTIADLTSRSRDVSLSGAAQKVQKFARPVGLTMVLLALVVLAIGVYRYFFVQSCLPKQKFPVARTSIAFTSFALAAIVIVIFGALVSGRSSN